MLLQAAHHQYHVSTTANYDEVLFDVAERFATYQSIRKVEIGGLLIWKRLQANTRWAMDLMNVPDQRVHELTRDAYLAANDLTLSVPEAARAARSALGSFPGFNTEFLDTPINLPDHRSDIAEDLVQINGSPIIDYTHFSLVLSRISR